MEEKRRHILTIINPVSGIGSKDKIPRLIDTVVDHEKNDVSIIMTEYPGHAREIAAQAVSDGTTYPLVKLEITNTSHPFFTGKQKLVDTAGRVDKFMQRYGNRKKK